MTKMTASLAFSGQYKPAHFEGEDIYDVFVKMMCAMVDMPDEVVERAYEVKKSFLGKMKYSSVCSSYGGTHITIKYGAHDPFLDAVTADMPLHPGLDYSETCNSQK